MLKKIRIVGFVALAVFAGSCASSVRYSARDTRAQFRSEGRGSASRAFNTATIDDSFRRHLIDYAQDYLGTPYCYGGVGPECMDCSAFVRAVFAQSDIALPRSAREMAELSHANRIRIQDVQAGDLLFFDTQSKGYPTHVGIAVSSDAMIHASSSGGVKIETFHSHYYLQTLLFCCSAESLRSPKI